MYLNNRSFKPNATLSANLNPYNITNNSNSNNNNLNKAKRRKNSNSFLIPDNLKYVITNEVFQESFPIPLNFYRNKFHSKIEFVTKIKHYINSTNKSNDIFKNQEIRIKVCEKSP